MDLVSVMLSLGAALTAIYGIKKMAENGFAGPYLAYIIIGLIMAVFFVRRQRQIDYPLIDLNLFRSPAFGTALIVNILGLFVILGFFLITAQYMQLVLGLDALTAGLWFIPGSLIFIGGSLLMPALIKRFRRSHIMAVSMLIAALGFNVIAHVAGLYNVYLYTLGNIILCTGFAPIGTVTTDMIMRIAPPERAGAASALSETSFEFGGAIGLAAMGSLALVLYRAAMGDFAPAGTSQAAMATLAVAMEQAQAMGAEGNALVTAARTAFTFALEKAALVGASICLLASGISLTLLKRAG